MKDKDSGKSKSKGKGKSKNFATDTGSPDLSTVMVVDMEHVGHAPERTTMPGVIQSAAVATRDVQRRKRPRRVRVPKRKNGGRRKRKGKSAPTNDDTGIMPNAYDKPSIEDVEAIEL